MFTFEKAKKKAAKHLKPIIDAYLELSEEQRNKLPLLYFVLGTGTPPFKYEKDDVDYTDTSSGEQKCSNCKYAYQKVVNGKYICSWVEGEIKPEGWCNKWTEYKEK